MSGRGHIIALDLSLTATGVCWVQPGDTRPDTFTIPTRSSDCIGKRLQTILDQLDRLGVDQASTVGPITHAIIEDLPTHARAAGMTGMVHGVVRHYLWNHFVGTITVPPATLKTWATGKGNAGKPEMLAEAIKRLEFDGHDDNEVDALWLWTLGAHLLGDPVVDLPKTHTRALAKLCTNGWAQ